MKEMMIVMAAMMPTEMIIEQLEEGILNYKLSDKEEDFHKIVFYCQILLAKSLVGDSPEESSKMIDRIKSIEQVEKFINPELS